MCHSCMGGLFINAQGPRAGAIDRGTKSSFFLCFFVIFQRNHDMRYYRQDKRFSGGHYWRNLTEAKLGAGLSSPKKSSDLLKFLT